MEITYSQILPEGARLGGVVSSSRTEGGEGGGPRHWTERGVGPASQKIVAGGRSRAESRKFCSSAHRDGQIYKMVELLVRAAGEKFGLQSDRCPESIDFGWFHCSAALRRERADEGGGGPTRNGETSEGGGSASQPRGRETRGGGLCLRAGHR